jgi:DNA-binding response OmpR family regulator
MNRVLVLVVEDEGFLSQALRDNLEAANCVVDIVENGEDALQHINAHRPNLIILDLLLPKKDGFAVLEEVKKSPELRAIPVVVLSNLGGDAEIKRALELGANDYFVKSQHPIGVVVGRIKQYLSGELSIGKSQAAN